MLGAAAHRRCLLTHDVQTMKHYAAERLRAGLHLSGVFIVQESLSIGAAVEEIVILVECSIQDEWDSIVTYLPL